jgi:hypothetical protein
MKRAGILLCVALLVMTVGAALGCGGGGSSGKTPKQVADAYMQATKDMDVDAAYDLMSEADQKNFTKEQMQAEIEVMKSYEVSYVIGEETIEGDTATVEVTVTVTDKASGQSQEVTDNLNLIKENGEWKIYLGDNL